jgi:L-lactate utilization protein LutC
MDYNKLASKSSLQKVIKAFTEKGYTAIVVKNGKEALVKIKELIPSGASVMNGSSVTLEQIGYSEYLASEKHSWIDFHARIAAENDKAKRAQLRRESVVADYYLGSVHALIENGEFIIASNTGSQLPHVVFTSAHLIFVVSTKKIVPTLEEAMKRLETHVVPLEDKHMQKLYGMGTTLNKVVLFKGENPMNKREILFLLVEENVGF